MARGENKIPERLINYNAYSKNNTLYGMATVELPELEAMSETVTGAGIAGEVESPTLGQYASMTATFTWRTIERAAFELSTPGSHNVDLRGSQQVYNAGTGTYDTSAVRVSLLVTPKNTSLGSFEPGAQTDTEQEFEVLYIKMWIDGKEVLEIDKFNYIVRFNGKDVLAKVRRDLGM